MLPLETRGRRRKQLLDDHKEKRRCWKLKEEALDRSQWRTRFERGYGPVVRQTTERKKERKNERMKERKKEQTTKAGVFCSSAD